MTYYVSKSSSRFITIANKQKEQLTLLSKVYSQNSTALDKAFESDLQKVDPTTFEGRDQFIQSFIKIGSSVQDSFSAFSGLYYLMGLCQRVEQNNLEEIFTNNQIDSETTKILLNIVKQLVVNNIQNDYDKSILFEKTQHAILPHLDSISTMIDFRLVPTNDENYELVPSIICTLKMHAPSHAAKESNVYFQISPYLLDRILRNLQNVQIKLNKETEYLNKKKLS